MQPDSAAPPPIHIRLHGVAQVQVADAQSLVLERKQAALLALLWLDGPSARARMATLLWPEADAKRGRGNLRQCLSRLRELAGELVLDRLGLLQLAPQARAEADVLEGGGLLGGFDYGDCEAFQHWLEGVRESRRSARQSALLAEVREATRQGEFDRAERLAERLLAQDRECEEAYRTLMEVFYLRGDYAAAIAVWDRCRDMLRQTYGVLPAQATRQLGEQLLHAARSAEPTRVMRLAALPVTALRPPRLVGRAAALEQLQGAWQAGAVACVSGVAGIGKSRLLAEFSALAGPVASAAARPGDALLPYAAMARLVMSACDRFKPELSEDQSRRLAGLMPQVAGRVGHAIEPAPQTEHERQQALQALRQLFVGCAARGCICLIFDDLQFADLASVEALADVLLRPAAASDELAAALPPWVLGTRSEEQTPQGTGLLDRLAAGRRLARVELQPLSSAQVAELLDSLALPAFASPKDRAELPERLHRQVGGNPAFLLESLKLVFALGVDLGDASAALPLAPGIEAVLERRVAMLSARARHVAQLAAIAGGEFSVALAAAALACTAIELSEPLRELEQRQVLDGRRFVHDLVAGAARRSIPAAVAEFMHRFVAEHLERNAVDPALVASHWAEAGEPRRAGLCYRAAAESARQRSRPVECAQLLDAAAASYARAGADDERFDAVFQRLQISEAPDRAVMRVEHLNTLEALARTEAQRLQVLSQQLGWRADHSQAGPEVTDLGQQGVQRAWAIARPDLAFAFVPPLAWQLAMRGDDAAAVALLEQHGDWAQRQADAATLAQFHVALSGIHGFGDRLLPAIEHAELAMAFQRQAGNEPGVLPMLSNIGLYRFWRGELEAARAVLLQAQVLRDRLHGRGAALIIDINLGCVLRDLGRCDEALALLQGALAEFRRVAAKSDPRTDIVFTENHLASVWLVLGDVENAAALLASDDSGVDLRFRARRLALRLRLARQCGRSDAHTLAVARAAAQGLAPGFNRAWLELELAYALPAAAAALEFARLCDEPSVLERPGMQRHALLKAAEAQARLGHTKAALAHLVEAGRLAQQAALFDLRPEDAKRIAQAVQGVIARDEGVGSR